MSEPSPPFSDIAAIESRLLLAMAHTLQVRAGVVGRHTAGQEIAKAIDECLGEMTSPTDPAILARAAQLTDEGYTTLGLVLSPQQVSETVSFFRSRPCYNGHIYPRSDRTPRTLEATAAEFHYGCYPLADVIAAPYLLELANHPLLLGIAQSYLGCLPTLYSLNAWWSFSGHGKAPLSQEFHRDQDDFKFCTLFVFLTEVGPDSGAHLYVRRSHRPDLAEPIARERGADPRRLYAGDGYGQDAFYEDVFDGLIDEITGPAGLGFLADTSGLHKGRPLTEGRRLMFWARYGLYRNLISASEMTPVPRSLIGDRLSNDAQSRYINRCIIEP